MMRVLDRAVYRELLPIFGMGVVLFTFFHLVDRLQHFTDLIATGAPPALVLRLFGLLMVSFLSHTLPMGLLMAVLVVASRIAADRELIALQAAGVSPLRLFRPFLVVGLVVSAGVGALSLEINQVARAAFFRDIAAIQAATPTPTIPERVFTQVGGLVVYADTVLPSAREMRGVLVADERTLGRPRLILAPRAHFVAFPDERRVVLRLEEGELHESGARVSPRYGVVRFHEFDTVLDVAAPLRALRARERPESNLRLWELLTATRGAAAGGDLSAAQTFVIEVHKRLAFPVAPLVFTIVGFALGVQLSRGGRGVAVGGSVAVLVLHYLLDNSLERLARFGTIPAWAAPWGPVALFGAIGLVLLRGVVRRGPAGWVARAQDAALAVGEALARVRSRRASVRIPRRRARGGSIIDHYLLRSFAVYLGYGLAASAALFFVIDLFETLDRYVAVRPPLSTLLEHYTYRIPVALHQALPVVALLSTVLLFMELSRHHELTALKAAGVSLYRVSRPVLLLAAGLSAGAFAFQETLLPLLTARDEALERTEIRGEPPRQLRPHRHFWSRVSETVFLRVDLLDPVGRKMSGVTLVEIDGGFRLVRRLDAHHAHWTEAGWQLADAILHEVGPGRPRATPIAQTVVELPNLLEDLAALQDSPATMTFRELRAYVHRLAGSGHVVTPYLVQLYAKVAFPLTTVVLTVLGIACALRWPSGGHIAGVAVAVVIVIAHWIMNALALSLGKTDLLSPLLAVWAANVVGAGIGVYLFLRTPT